MAKQTLYEFLGIAPDADDAMIAALINFHRKECEIDPDPQERQNRLLFLKYAEETLCNPRKRAVYDRQLSPAANPAQPVTSPVVAEALPKSGASRSRIFLMSILLLGSALGAMKYANSRHANVPPPVMATAPTAPQIAAAQEEAPGTAEYATDSVQVLNPPPVDDASFQAPAPIAAASVPAPASVIVAAAKPMNECGSTPCLHLSDDLIPLTLRGETWVLHVWGSWCPYCRADHPKLMAMDAIRRGKVVSVLYKDSEQASARYLAANGNPYGGGQLGDARAVLDLLNIRAVPATFVINADGNIVRRYQGALSVKAQAQLEAYLGG